MIVSTQMLDEWPAYSATLKKIKYEDDKKIYQCQELKYFSEAKQYYFNHYVEFCESATECLRSQMEWPDQQSLQHHAVHFMSLLTLDYHAVWWRIFNSPVSSEWLNILVLAVIFFTTSL